MTSSRRYGLIPAAKDLHKSSEPLWDVVVLAPLKCAEQRFEGVNVTSSLFLCGGMEWRPSLIGGSGSSTEVYCADVQQEEPVYKQWTCHVCNWTWYPEHRRIVGQCGNLKYLLGRKACPNRRPQFPDTGRRSACSNEGSSALGSTNFQPCSSPPPQQVSETPQNLTAEAVAEVEPVHADELSVQSDEQCESLSLVKKTPITKTKGKMGLRLTQGPAVEQSALPPSPDSETPQNPGGTKAPKLRVESIYCPDCDFYLNGPVQIADHREGKKHKKKVERNAYAAAAAVIAGEPSSLASSSVPAPPIPDQDQSLAAPMKPCRFYLNGRCLRGENCTFVHNEDIRARADVMAQSLSKDDEQAKGPSESTECEMQTTGSTGCIKVTVPADDWTKNHGDMVPSGQVPSVPSRQAYPARRVTHGSVYGDAGDRPVDEDCHLLVQRRHFFPSTRTWLNAPPPPPPPSEWTGYHLWTPTFVTGAPASSDFSTGIGNYQYYPSAHYGACMNLAQSSSQFDGSFVNQDFQDHWDSSVRFSVGDDLPLNDLQYSFQIWDSSCGVSSHADVVAAGAESVRIDECESDTSESVDQHGLKSQGSEPDSNLTRATVLLAGLLDDQLVPASAPAPSNDVGASDAALIDEIGLAVAKFLDGDGG